MGVCWGWLGVRIDGSGGPGPPGPVQADQHTEFIHAINWNSPMVCENTYVRTSYIQIAVSESGGLIYYLCVFIRTYVCMYIRRYNTCNIKRQNYSWFHNSLALLIGDREGIIPEDILGPIVLPVIL